MQSLQKFEQPIAAYTCTASVTYILVFKLAQISTVGFPLVYQIMICLLIQKKIT